MLENALNDQNVNNIKRLLKILIEILFESIETIVHYYDDKRSII
ncbi:3920_t:CDS:2 [Racocetra fulgida]|uniref:3920_t:CDS:1 n=1 Tax=Racocetra fulgida TaxID=60492 RepID=A0A9N8VVP9_9GLOM|nr:3920_t:CDS:2 [Racocetra fulgida]